MKITPVERLEGDMRRQKERSHMVRLDITKIPKKVRAKILERYDAWEFHSGVNLALFANVLFDIVDEMWENGRVMSFDMNVERQRGAIKVNVSRLNVSVKVRYQGPKGLEAFENQGGYCGAVALACKVLHAKIARLLGFSGTFES